jgi:N-acetylglucosaminyldiphosphoundecaprenol N-acetyl-beta-D-mannosaminyltransferase
MKENILGFNIDVNSMNEIDKINIETLYTAKKQWIACFNPHSYVVSTNDKVFNDALKNANFLLPDGFGVVLGSKLLGGKIKKRVTGYDIFEKILYNMNKSGGGSIYFLGSSLDTLRRIECKIKSDYPNVRIAGTFSPSYTQNDFSPNENDLVINSINNSAPDVLFVGLSAPKQEKWIYQNIELLDIKLACAIGAVFDFYAGKIKRSHPFFQDLGLEWLPRLLQEPKRLWKRTFVSAPIFLYHILKQYVKKINKLPSNIYYK